MSGVLKSGMHSYSPVAKMVAQLLEKQLGATPARLLFLLTFVVTDALRKVPLSSAFANELGMTVIR